MNLPAIRNRHAGVESLHVAIDDHSRLAFACLLPDEKIGSVVSALHQAVEFYKTHGITIQRVLTDRGTSYRSHDFANACQKFGISHLFTKPYRPQTNGKAERFIQPSPANGPMPGCTSPVIIALPTFLTSSLTITSTDLTPL